LTSVTTLRVPGSSANLGPGFDALGIALQVHLTCRFSRAAKFSIRCSGRDASLISCNEDNLIWQTALTVASRARLALPAAALEIENEIPLGKGLGSSAAAITAGVVIGARLLDLDWKPARILDEAARLEGHPDNVAACVLGSVVASAVEPGGITRAIRLEMPANFRIAVVVPDFALPTKEARAVLPDVYSRADATFNIQRADCGARYRRCLGLSDRSGRSSAPTFPCAPGARADRDPSPARAGPAGMYAQRSRTRCAGVL